MAVMAVSSKMAGFDAGKSTDDGEGIVPFLVG